MAEEENLETQTTEDEEKPDAEAKEGSESKEGETKDEVPAAQPQNDEVKHYKDKYAQANGHLAVSLKAVNAMKEEYGATDAEIAEKLGLSEAEVKAILGQAPAPDDPIAAAASTLLEQYGTPGKPGTMRAALDEAFGEDTSKAFEAYNWLVGVDPTEAQKLADQDPSKLAAYAVKRGKEVMAEFEELKTHGSPLAAYRALKKAGSVKADPKPETPSSQPSAPQPTAVETGDLTKAILG